MTKIDNADHDVQQLAAVLKTLASDTRLGIIRLLKRQPLCVGALAARLEVTQAAVSQHLRILRSADLVIPDRRGYFVHYRLNEEALAGWCGAIDRLLGADDAHEHEAETSQKKED